jgi:hypothetical protein
LQRAEPRLKIDDLEVAAAFVRVVHDDQPFRPADADDGSLFETQRLHVVNARGDVGRQRRALGQRRRMIAGSRRHDAKTRGHRDLFGAGKDPELRAHLRRRRATVLRVRHGRQ